MGAAIGRSRCRACPRRMARVSCQNAGWKAQKTRAWKSAGASRAIPWRSACIRRSGSPISANRDPTRLLKILFDAPSMREDEPLTGKIRRLLTFYENKLPPQRKALLQLISLFRSPIDQRTLARLARRLSDTKAILTPLPAPVVKRQLEDLRNEHLILCEPGNGGPDLYSSHPILRDHFRLAAISGDLWAAMGIRRPAKREAVERAARRA